MPLSDGYGAVAAQIPLLGLVFAACGAPSAESKAGDTEAAASGSTTAPVAAEDSSGGASASGQLPDGSTSSTASTGGTELDTGSADTGAPVDRADGPPIAVVPMTSLGNVPIRSTHSIRFRAEYTGEIASVRQYFIAPPTAPGYAAGDGGVIRIEIAHDEDGLPGAALPGQVEATFPDVVDGNYQGEDYGKFVRESLLGLYALDASPTVIAGEVYHVLYTNVHPDPNANYISSDHCLDLLPLDEGPGEPIDAPSKPEDLGLTRAGVDQTNHPDGHNYIPIFQIHYDDGRVQGQGFMEWEHEQPFTLAGSSTLRTTITLPADREVSELAMQVPFHASGLVDLSLRTLAGDVLASATASADGRVNHRGATWAIAAIDPVTLAAGVDYAFVVAPADGYTGTLVPIKAGAAYGFEPNTLFPYGEVQVSDNGEDYSPFATNLYFSMIVH